MSKEEIIEIPSKDFPIGQVRLWGPGAEGANIGAQKASDALLGFQKLFQYVATQEDSRFSSRQFDLPVKIRQGSTVFQIAQDWGRIILENPAWCAFAAVYMGAFAKQAAEKGLLETGTVKDLNRLARTTFKGILALIRIGKFVGGIGIEFLKKVQVKATSADVILLVLPDGSQIEVNLWEYDLFEKCPKELLSVIAGTVDENIELEIASWDSDGTVHFEYIKRADRDFFVIDDSEKDILFPEMIHGEYVELEGFITRINERTQTIGFEYKGHILTCIPNEGSVLPFKDRLISQRNDHFFQRVTLKGYVERLDINDEYKATRPRISFVDIIPLEESDDQMLF